MNPCPSPVSLAAYADRVSVMRDRRQVGMLDNVSVDGIIQAIAS